MAGNSQPADEPTFDEVYEALEINAPRRVTLILYINNFIRANPYIDNKHDLDNLVLQNLPAELSYIFSPQGTRQLVAAQQFDINASLESRHNQ